MYKNIAIGILIAGNAYFAFKSISLAKETEILKAQSEGIYMNSIKHKKLAEKAKLLAEEAAAEARLAKMEAEKKAQLLIECQGK
ncbi:hypothetical protein [Reichenbachiella versicolor]|uniref:hypothetical protein n=1 Tax=Reichenbachiella versicolor TaxID=1821036 RepID=UPI000D6E74C2|nr:hypothetical protein [Reichenbachiella versicolor]